MIPINSPYEPKIKLEDLKFDHVKAMEPNKLIAVKKAEAKKKKAFGFWDVVILVAIAIYFF